MEEKLKGCFLHETDHWKTPSKMYQEYMGKGRLHFNDAKNGAPFPSIIIILK